MIFKNEIAVNQDMPSALFKIIRSKAQTRIWHFLQYKCKCNLVLLRHKEIVERYGIRAETVSRSLKELEKKGLITRDGKEGTTNRYFLNPHYVWKSGETTHKSALTRWDEIQQCKEEKQNA